MATQGTKAMPVVDLKDGFYSIEITEEDKYKTAFEFNGRVYEWNSMIMGYKNTPQILQRNMDDIFRDLKGKGVEIYIYIWMILLYTVAVSKSMTGCLEGY